MATAKSDEESDLSSHPLAENRPGVYVQVVAPRRRKKGNKRGDAAQSSRPPADAHGPASKAEAARAPMRVKEVDGRGQKRPSNRAKKGTSAAPPAEQNEVAALPASEVAALRASAREPHAASSSDAPTAASGFAVGPSKPEEAADVQASLFSSRAEPRASTAEEEEEDDGRQSGERSVDFESMRAREASSANTNHGTDLLGLSIPPPPRLPSFTPHERDIQTDPPPPLHSASLLDAPHSLRPAPESTPAARPSFTLLAFVAAFSAIIVTAGLVALRELTKDAPTAASASVPLSAQAQAQAQAPAPRDMRPRVEQLADKVAPSAEPAAQPAQPDEAPKRPGAPSAAVRPVSARPLPPTQQKVTAARAAQSLARAVKPGVAKAAGALRAVLSGETDPAEADEPASDEEREPAADEPLELPFNPYR